MDKAIKHGLNQRLHDSVTAKSPPIEQDGRKKGSEKHTFRQYLKKLRQGSITISNEVE